MDTIGSQRPESGGKAESAAAYQRELDECLKTAVTLHSQGHLDGAKQLYTTLLSIDPDHFDAIRLLGVMANQLGQHATACDFLARATTLQPDHVDALYHYGLALQSSDRPDAAATIYAQAFSLAPDKAQIAENLAVALVDAGQEQEAIDVCQRALELEPSSAIAHSNLGTLCFNRGDTERARHHFERLVQLRPALGQAHEKLASVELREGRYAEGWCSYEWRFASETFLQINPPRHGAYPSWSGEDLAGQTILVTPEQGVGDEVMFASCIAELIEQAQHVIVQCDPRLQALFARSFPSSTVIAATVSTDDLQIDCCVTAGSLPRFFRSTAHSFHRRAYLIPDAERVEYWRKYLDHPDHGPLIGMSWRAGRQARAQLARSIELKQWRSVFSTSASRIINLQYGDHEAELDECETAGIPIPTTLEGLDPLTNLDDFAALLVALDLVVTVDNSTAHLAAALGVATWVLLPSGAEWRWGVDSEDTCWYDSVRLFRQSCDHPGEWRTVLADVSQALQTFSPVQAEPVKANQSPNLVTKRDSQSAANAILLNDTRNWYHFGCTGTSLALHHQLRRRYRTVSSVAITDTMNLAGVPTTLAGFRDPAIADVFFAANRSLLATLNEADHVYLNGEGTIHGRSPAACALLYLAWLGATRLGKPVSIINHSAYPGDHEGQTLYREVYRAMQYVGVREPVSARTIRALGIEVTDTFDSLPLYIDEQYKPRPSKATSEYAVLAGGVTWHEGATPALTRLVKHLRRAALKVVVLIGARAYPAGEELRFAEAMSREHSEDVRMVCAKTEHEWLDTIAGAQLLVSGRFHHSIAAAFLGTPLVASDSNTPKMNGLMEVCELQPAIQTPVDWTSAEIDRFASDLCERAELAMSNPETFSLQPALRRQLIERARKNYAS